MKTEQAKELLSQAIGGFKGIPVETVEWGVAIAAHFYTMGHLDGLADKTTERLNVDSLGEATKEMGLEPFDEICKTLSNIPGSGYEFLKK